MAKQFRERLFEPQLQALGDVLRAAGVRQVGQAAGRLLAPIFYRWFMRLPLMSPEQVIESVDLMLANGQ